MKSLETNNNKKLPQKIKNLWMEYIKTIELNSWEEIYLLKNDFKYFLLDKKLRNKFIPKEWIHEDKDGISFHMNKDIDNTDYLIVELSWVAMYFSENWKTYKPKNSIYSIKKSLFNIISWFVDNLWIPSIFSTKTNKIGKFPKNDNINYKK